MAGIGRKLNVAVAATRQDVLSSNPIATFAQFAEPTALTEGQQEFQVYPLWPGQRTFSVPFDAVYFVGEGEWDAVLKEFPAVVDACHRYLVAPSPPEDYLTLCLQAAFLPVAESASWQSRLLSDYRDFTQRLLAFFQVFDAEGSGAFTVNTFSSLMGDTLTSFGSNAPQHLYEDIDRHRDFKIDFEELENWWRKGRTGESRKVINAAVAKFQPCELQLRDFPHPHTFRHLAIATDDSLPKRSVYEIHSQFGPSGELLPHIKSLPGDQWGLLLPVSDSLSALYESLKTSDGFTESRSEQSIAFFRASAESTEYDYCHFTLQSAVDFSQLSENASLEVALSSFAFKGVYHNPNEGTTRSHKTAKIPAFSTDDMLARRAPKVLIQFLHSIQAEVQKLKALSSLPMLPDESITAFWITREKSNIVKIAAKGWRNSQ